MPVFRGHAETQQKTRKPRHEHEPEQGRDRRTQALRKSSETRTETEVCTQTREHVRTDGICSSDQGMIEQRPRTTRICRRRIGPPFHGAPEVRSDLHTLRDSHIKDKGNHRYAFSHARSCSSSQISNARTQAFMPELPALGFYSRSF